MKTRLVVRIAVFLAITLSLSLGSYAQQLTNWCPLRCSIRACAVSPSNDEVYVGDSSFIVMTKNNTWQNYGFFDKSVTLYAACYADAQDVAVAGSKGRIYYTTNDGTSWSRFNLGTSATIRAMATDGSGDYFAVGDSGMIIESTDAGAHWLRLASPTTKQLNAIEFGASGQYGVAAGNDSAIVVSTDGGSTWNAEAMPYNLSSLGSVLHRVDFSSVAISTNEDSVWLALEQPALPLLLIQGKADPNQKFTVFPNSGPLTSLIYTGDTGWAYLQGFAADDYAYNITPSGKFTRNAIALGADADGNIDTSAQRIRCAAIEPIGNGGWILIYCGDDLDICRETQTGLVYSQGEPGHAFTGDYLDADVINGKGWIVASQGKIDWTNYGVNTRSLQEQAGKTINSVWTRDDITGIVIGWDGLILRTNDGGNTWSSVPSGTQERLHGIAFPTANDGIIAGDYGTILRSTDTGNSWMPIANSATTYLRTVAFADDHTGIAAGDSGAIFRTTDTGLTWQPINNFLTGTDVSIRKLQAFPGGLYYAQAGGDLIRSTDNGLNWSVLPSPGDAIAMSFYNSQIGLIGSRATSSALVPDTVYMSYTTDGGASWKPFVVPMQTARRLVIYWLNDHQAILNGIDGFVTEVTISSSGVSITPMPVATSDVRVYPNPTAGDFRIDYSTKYSGLVTIQIFSEDGTDMGTLFSGTEQAGEHTQAITPPTGLQGSYFIKVSADGTSTTNKVTIQ